VDIKHFFNSLRNIKHDPFSCTFQNLNLINERKNGFFSEFIFKCDLCNKIDIISNEPKTTDISLSINTAIVMATINSGQGFAQLDTMSAFLNMPSMSNMTYQKLHLDVSNHTNDTAIKAMILAGNEEAEIAKKEGNVNENGIPLITVIADGAWSKRSYKSGYNALSGVVSISRILYIYRLFDILAITIVFFIITTGVNYRL